jgi:hypothetical protein
LWVCSWSMFIGLGRTCRWNFRDSIRWPLANSSQLLVPILPIASTTLFKSNSQDEQVPSQCVSHGALLCSCRP